MIDIETLESRIMAMLVEITGADATDFTPETPLIGAERALKSRELVELLLELEDFAEDDLGVVFDWTSDSAMSERNSIFRTVAALAAHIKGLTA